MSRKGRERAGAKRRKRESKRKERERGIDRKKEGR